MMQDQTWKTEVDDVICKIQSRIKLLVFLLVWFDTV